jgi:hypothetical protein
MAVDLPADALSPFPRFSLYNSPYPAHDEGCAVDLYPGPRGDRSVPAPSPVAGEVVEVRETRAPSRPYADDAEYLLVVDTGAHLARILHVEPSVTPGETVAVGDSLGTTVRSGYFAPWVDDHLHLGFRERDGDPLRASGSLPLALPVDVAGVTWDGTGTVVRAGETFVALDSPAHPSPGAGYAALAADDGTPLDGGLVHYAGGGAYGDTGNGGARRLSLLGTHVGRVDGPDGRTVEWADVAVSANGERVTGLSLFAAREGLGAKLVCPDHAFAVGDQLSVTVEPTDDPVRLG